MRRERSDDYKALVLLLAFVVVFLLGFAFGCFVCSSGGTGTLTVQVVDSDGDPAPQGVEVLLGGGGPGVTQDTDANGEAVFENIEATSGVNIKVGGKATNVTGFNYDGTNQTITVEAKDNYGPSKPDGWAR